MAEVPLAVRSVRHVQPHTFFGRCRRRDFDRLQLEQLERRIAVTHIRRFGEPRIGSRKNDSHETGMRRSRLRDTQSRRQRMHTFRRVRVVHQFLSAAKFDHREPFVYTAKYPLIWAHCFLLVATAYTQALRIPPWLLDRRFGARKN